MSLNVYWGEFLTSPIPLELSVIEPCDYGCRYCFAVLNDKHRASAKRSALKRSSAKKVMNFLMDFRNRDTLEAELLKQGYPVLMSNRTDPFSRANRSATIPMLSVMRDLGIQVAIQTKGFIFPDDEKQVLDSLEPSCWYISIATPDESVRQLVEPAAPPIQHRLELITRLRNAGHSVIVGVNPYVPGWIAEPKAFIEDLKVRGCQGIWTEVLHFNKDQINQLTEKDKQALTPEIVANAKVKSAHKRTDYSDFLAFRDLVRECGLDVFSIGQHEPSNIWDNFRRHYTKTFPTVQDFVNILHQCKFSDGTFIPYDAFWDAFGAMLPTGKQRCGHYIGASAHQIPREMGWKWTNHMTYEELCRMSWADSRIKFSPCRNLGLNLAVQKDGENYYQLLDDINELPLLAWHPNGSNEMYFVID